MHWLGPVLCFHIKKSKFKCAQNHEYLDWISPRCSFVFFFFFPHMCFFACSLRVEYNMPLCFLCVFVSGTCLGTFCMDCSFTSGSPDGSSLGVVTILCLLWPWFTDNPGLFSSYFREDDGEVQVVIFFTAWRNLTWAFLCPDQKTMGYH